MTEFTIHTAESAPEGSRAGLAAARQKFGMVPNLLGVLAGAPAALTSYLTTTEAMEGSSLSPQDQQVVFIATSVANRCEYCVSVHTAIAGMAEIPPETTDALRAGRDPEDERAAELARLARSLVGERGCIEEADIEAFGAAGFSDQQLLEVITGVALKTLSNDVNHIAETPLDPAFEGVRWTPAAVA
ncbi:MAG: peroxidase-related enzyme [Miltoncostaeaceae bacterium]